MAAKPIIDIIVGVRDVNGLDSHLRALNEAGYEYRGELGVPGRHYFRKGSMTASNFHVNVVEFDGTLWLEYLGFRDVLRENPEAAKRYDRLKRQLAKQFANERASYTNGKAEFIQIILITYVESSHK